MRLRVETVDDGPLVIASRRRDVVAEISGKLGDSAVDVLLPAPDVALPPLLHPLGDDHRRRAALLRLRIRSPSAARHVSTGACPASRPRPCMPPRRGRYGTG